MILEQFINHTKHLNLYNIVILKDGKKVAQHNWKPEERHNQFSITKSFVSAAIGFAIEEGFLELNDCIMNFFDTELVKGADEIQRRRLYDLTIEDLLVMGAGYEEARFMADRKTLGNVNWDQVALNIPLVREKREKFLYTNVTAYLVGRIVEKVSGENLIDYLMPRLFEPLGITRPECEMTPEGYAFGASGLMLTTEEISRFGQLYLQKGIYNGKQVLSKEWIQLSTQKQIETNSVIIDEGDGYGYFFRRGSHNSYRATGKNGQMCIVLEQENVVIAINSDETNTKSLREYIWLDIYPMLPNL